MTNNIYDIQGEIKGNINSKEICLEKEIKKTCASEGVRFFYVTMFEQYMI